MAGVSDRSSHAEDAPRDQLILSVHGEIARVPEVNIEEPIATT